MQMVDEQARGGRQRLARAHADDEAASGNR
jgi:hypothetical protein